MSFTITTNNNSITFTGTIPRNKDLTLRLETLRTIYSNNFNILNTLNTLEASFNFNRIKKELNKYILSK